MMAFDFTWSDNEEYVISKVNQRLGLLRSIKHLLPLNTLKLFYNSLVLSVFDYADLVWGDKNNVSLTNDLQILQNKAAKIPLATKDLGKQRVCCHSLKDWNNLNKATRNVPDIVNLKLSIFSSFYIQLFVFQLQLFINSLYSFCTYFYL